jgi:hypothetical protein
MAFPVMQPTATPVSQPVYEVIKKQDIQAAFKDAVQDALAGVLSSINNLIDIYSNTAPSSLWTWGQTSRWDYDMWW